ncbi:methionine biosynthesis protein MetW [Candidatus Marinamargulisbacteria bacterium SCGC AG-343-D04]|nr:methionine biosynthesis protein MetW [Candidatus Marinamargulisbacteria bacterium SCGC AG-343-D04]
MSHIQNEDILSYISKKDQVLDLGCGEGDLLELLRDKKSIDGYGIEKDPGNVMNCIQKGLSVFHGDIQEGLSQFPDQSFDTVILSQTLQQVQNPLEVIHEMCRVGKVAIVTFPNFAHWKTRFQLLKGIIPKSDALPYEWYNTPNIRVVSIKSFKRICKKEKIRILHQKAFSSTKRLALPLLHNLCGQRALFVIKKE